MGPNERDLITCLEQMPVPLQSAFLSVLEYMSTNHTHLSQQQILALVASELQDRAIDAKLGRRYTSVGTTRP